MGSRSSGQFHGRHGKRREGHVSVTCRWGWSPGSYDLLMSRLFRAATCAFFGLVLAGCGGGGAAEPEAVAEVSTELPEPTVFEEVLESCEVSEDALGDGGKTLQLDGAGKDDRSLRDGEMVTSPGKLSASDLGCALGTIGTSDAAIARMESTRAMDGMQEFAEDGFTYVWTFHPDSGLDIIVTDDAA